MEDGNLSEDELSGMHEIYGYEDQKSYFRAVQTQINRINELNKKYNFSELSSYEKRTVIFKTFKEINLFQIEKTSSDENLMDNSCESIRRNCIASVAAESAIMHFGCAALDLTIIAGIACHSAAIAYQYSAGNNCNLEAEKCNKLTEV